LLLPADMREWLPEDDLVFVVLDAVAALDLGGFRRRYRADGHGRAAFDPEMMVALLLYGYCQGEPSSRVIERRCVRDAGYRVITGGLHPDHATIARFRRRHPGTGGNGSSVHQPQRDLRADQVWPSSHSHARTDTTHPRLCNH
jgi:transposase